MDVEKFKEAVIARCQALGIRDYELYYETGASTSVSAFQHELNQFSASEDGGVCLRCLVNGKMGYASTQALDPEQAELLVSKAADNASILESEDTMFLGKAGQVYETPAMPGYPLPTTEALIDCALSTQEMLYAAHPQVIDGTETQAISETLELHIVNSQGLDLHYSNRLSGLVTAVMVGKDGEMANDFDVKLGQLSRLDRQAMVKKTVDAALQKLGGEPAPTGQYPVVFSSEAMSDLLATFAGIFSSEAAQKGLSRLADAEGTEIASPLVTITDDPFHRDSPMPMPFDAEGSPTRRKNIVEKGPLTTLLYNLKTAHKAGKTTTGNASKGGYDAPIGIRPFSLVLQGGEKAREQVLQDVGYGVYVNSLNGLHAGADPITGDFSLQSAGFMIENGIKTRYVKSFTVAGNFYQLLKDIAELANDSHLPMPMGSTAYGAPTTVVHGLTISGTDTAC